MARQPRTPGATTEAPKTTEVATPTTAQQSDDVLNEILGTPDIEDAKPTTSTEPTGTAYKPEILLMGEPIDEDPQAKSEYEEFLEWRKNKAVAAKPVAQHVPASGVPSEPVTKRTRQFCGPQGWTSEEY